MRILLTSYLAQFGAVTRLVVASAPLFPELEVSLLNSHVSSLNSLAVGFGCCVVLGLVMLQELGRISTGEEVLRCGFHCWVPSRFWMCSELASSREVLRMIWVLIRFFELCVLCRGDFSSAWKANSGERLFAFVWCGLSWVTFLRVLTLGVPYFLLSFIFFQIVFQFLLFLW
jgi:hypothetical protein